MVWNVFKRPRPTSNGLAPSKKLATGDGLPVTSVDSPPCVDAAPSFNGAPSVDATPNIDVTPNADTTPSAAVPVTPGTESYPYSLPSPPKSWLFGGLGYGYGIGCSVGPVFGLGVGMSPGGVQFGAGALPVGVFCGVGLAAGAIVGQGSAYVPYGFTSGFFLAPRFVMLEGMAEIYRDRMAKRRAVSDAKRMTRRHEATSSTWPRALRDRVQKWLQSRNSKRITDSPSSSAVPQKEGRVGVTLPPSFVSPYIFPQAGTARCLPDSQLLISR